MNRTFFAAAMAAAWLFAGCHDAVSRDAVVVDSPAALKYALAQASPGDVIVWEDGEYDSVRINFRAEGTQEAPVVLRAQTSGGVTLKGASQIKISGSWLAVEGFRFDSPDSSVSDSPLYFSKGSSHCRVSDCAIDGSGSGYSSTDCKWVSIYGEANEVSRCSFTDKRTMGCLLVVWMESGIVPRHVIRGNRFTRPYTHYDESTGKALNGQEIIRIGTSTYSMSEASCIVEGNWFKDCDGELAEVISNKSCSNLYEGNLFEDCRGSLTLRHGNGCTVRGNFFLSSGKSDVGGVRIIGENHIVEGNWLQNLTGSGYKSAICLVRGESAPELSGYWTVKNAVVRDNALVDCKQGIVVNCSGRSSQDSAPEDVTFSGNTIVSDSSKYTSVTVIDTPEGNLHWEGNVIWGGKQSGVQLPLCAERPDVADRSAEIQSIRDNSGTSW